MKKKDKVVVDLSDPEVVIVNGKKFKLDREKLQILDHHIHGDKAIFKEFNEEQYNKDLDFIIDNIEEIVDKRELLKELLKRMPLEHMEKAKRLIKHKHMIKLTKGCYSLTVGNNSKGMVIPLA
jgi:glucosamine 6-phosphate synthetase-like amidotransferase/phosphosugar isomerase protein